MLKHVSWVSSLTPADLYHQYLIIINMLCSKCGQRQSPYTISLWASKCKNVLCKWPCAINKDSSGQRPNSQLPCLNRSVHVQCSRAKVECIRMPQMMQLHLRSRLLEASLESSEPLCETSTNSLELTSTRALRKLMCSFFKLYIV